MFKIGYKSEFHKMEASLQAARTPVFKPIRRFPTLRFLDRVFHSTTGHMATFLQIKGPREIRGPPVSTSGWSGCGTMFPASLTLYSNRYGSPTMSTSRLNVLFFIPLVLAIGLWAQTTGTLS